MSRMRTQFGSMPEKADGLLKKIRFPRMATLDQWTGDGRMITSEGFGTRELPLSIMAQFAEASGHDGAVPVGALHELTINTDGTLSGSGWLVDSEEGRKSAFLMATYALRGNSIELADVEAEVDFSDDMSARVKFTKANLAATAIVARPAFGDAYAELDDDEMVASFADLDEIVVDTTFTVRIAANADDTVFAEPGIVQPWDAFYVPEAETPQKIVVTAEGVVYGHLGLWNSCHDGIEGQCVMIPRPTDNYASFNKAGVLTDKGIVETGPIFLYGGHPKAGLGPRDPHDAYGGVENAWADVRVSVGQHGPWLSGVVRPGIEETKIYAGRASRISGHWKGGKLRAIVSVNAEGYDVPGSGFSFSLGSDGEVNELVASFPACATEDFAKYDGINFTPPSAAQAEARRGLEWRDEYNRGGTEVGVARARDISNGKNMSPDTINRMVSYFARHEVDKEGEGWSPSQDGYPSAGRIAWALWGGDPGRSFANRVKRQMEARDADASAPLDMFAPVANGGMVDYDNYRGRIEHVMTEGILGVEGSEYSIEASEDDPAVLIRVFDMENGMAETKWLLGARASETSPVEVSDEASDDAPVSFSKGVDLVRALRLSLISAQMDLTANEDM